MEILGEAELQRPAEGNLHRGDETIAAYYPLPHFLLLSSHPLKSQSTSHLLSQLSLDPDPGRRGLYKAGPAEVRFTCGAKRTGRGEDELTQD